MLVHITFSIQVFNSRCEEPSIHLPGISAEMKETGVIDIPNPRQDNAGLTAPQESSRVEAQGNIQEIHLRGHSDEPMVGHGSIKYWCPTFFVT